jgi:putative prophage lambdaCh01, repressor protein
MKENIIGKRLKELRKPLNNTGISMDELCNIFKEKYNLNVNKSMISRWENGTAIPDNKHIVAYAKYFDIDMNYLIGLTNVPRKISEIIIDKNIKLDKDFSDIYECLKNIPDKKLFLIKKIIFKLIEMDNEKIEAYDTILK